MNIREHCSLTPVKSEENIALTESRDMLLSKLLSRELNNYEEQLDAAEAAIG